ncbi:MAG: hypothetical protein AAB686_03655 [Patescibacteria group bacterium]
MPQSQSSASALPDGRIRVIVGSVALFFGETRHGLRIVRRECLGGSRRRTVSDAQFQRAFHEALKLRRRGAELPLEER